MTIKKLMAPFTSVNSADATFLAAVDAAAPFNAHIDVVHVRQEPAMPTGAYHPFPYGYVPIDINEVTAAARSLENDLAAAFNRLCEAHRVKVCLPSEKHAGDGVTASWRPHAGDYPGDFARQARAADLIAMARPNQQSPAFEDDLLEDLLFQSGLPALIGGPGGAAGPCRSVCIAWDGSKEASRAAHAAMPFCAKADTVEIVTIGALPSGVRSADALADYYSLHGLRAGTRAIAPDGRRDCDAMAEHIAANDVDLLAMGAYSHSRWREMILGGFTRFFLHQEGPALLMAH